MHVQLAITPFEIALATVHTGAFALVASTLGLIVGVAGAIAAAALGRSSEMLLARAVEAMGAFPPVILVTLVAAMFPHAGVWAIVLALAFFRAVEVALVVQATARQLERTGFVHAAISLGASRFEVLRRHMLPYLAPAALLAAVSGIGAAALVELSLACLELGGVRGGLGTTLVEAVRDRDASGTVMSIVALVALITPGFLLVERARERLDPTRSQDGPFRRGGIVLWSRPCPYRFSTNEASRTRCCAASSQF